MLPKRQILTGTAGMVLLVIWLLLLPVALRTGSLRPDPAAAAEQVEQGPRTPQNSIVLPAPRTRAALSYTVKPGDTLSAIAVKYGVLVDQLARANRLVSTNSLAVGEDLVVPVSAPVPGNPLAGATALALPWPVTGPVSSPFGWRTIFGRREFHTGIDIAVPVGTPIRAPLAGRVVFAGPLGTYGLAVIMDHGAGFSTLYAHASRLLVQTGQKVAAGQTIALVGQTGDATGSHLHFETRVDGLPQNPLDYLGHKQVRRPVPNPAGQTEPA